MITSLLPDRRALRTIQAPDHIQKAEDRPGGFRVSSAAFKAGSDGSISIDLEQSLELAGLELTSQFKALARAVALVAHSVGRLQQEGLSVEHAPIVGNEHHGEVRFDKLSKREKRDVARALADECETIVGIDPAEAQRQIEIRAAAKAEMDR